ncbi:hypothetical protein POTOM_050123 [Populus tomentosa]|uniref:F-box domain-containing protein n=1 Tax=Populus tomentosa TaxID=118781 RepID=A0A8X8C904_POPTO|nr:hypothetical protein POTOM_050123 [Populus tomentosa]
MSGDLLISLSIPLLCLGSCSSVREQARGHRGNVQEPTPDQLMSFPESEVFGFNKLENQDLFVRGHAGVQANDANSQEAKSEISLDMLVQGQKGEQHEIGGFDTSDAVIERHGSLDSKAQSGETLETQELTSVEAMDIDTGTADVGGKRFSEPYFMRKLLRKEIESGFGGINSISGTQVDGFRLPEEQASKNLDGLVLPLLIDICKKVGLFLPPCLMRLPTELKVKILESLAATDIAKMESVSSEMQCLSSNNDPWQQKFVEFGDGTGALGTVNWKEQFTSYWENKKKRKRDVNAMARLSSSSALFLPNQEKFCWYSSTQWSSWSRISSISLKFCSKL